MKDNVKVIFLFFSLCILIFNACEQFRARPNIRELGRNLETNFICDMQVADSSLVNIFIKEQEMQNISNMDEYIEVIDYIPLETSEEVLIGNIDKLLFYNNYFYILDSHIAKSIFIFYSDGRFKSKISRYGQGKNEYKYLRDMEIDTINKQLIAYDRNDGKLLFFDLEGNYLNKKKVGFRFSNFKFFPNGNCFFYTDNNPNENIDISKFSMLIGQLNGRMFYRGFKNSSFLENLKYADGFYLCENKDKIIISPRLSNAIFEVDSHGNSKKLYQIHFPLGGIDSYESIDISNFIKEMENSKYYYSLGGNTLLDDSLFHFKFINPKGENNTLWYNRNTDKYHIVSVQQSLSGKIIDVPMPLLIEHSRCIGAIDALQVFRSKTTFLEAYRNEKIDELSNSLLQRIETFSENDNPVLMIYKVKWNHYNGSLNFISNNRF